MFERLTIRTDICIEPENDIVYHNPNDPEGMYNILDLAECLYSGGEAEAGILMEISRRLAAYEDTGLTPEQIRELQNAFNILFESERQKQQENEQLRAQAARMREVLEQFKYDYEQNCPIHQNYLAVCRLLREDTVQAYHNPADVEALRKARKALYAARVDVLTKETDELAREALAEIDKVMGGEKDA